MIVTRSDFLETLDLYLAELPADLCYQQARDYYVQCPSSYRYMLDNKGSPAAQLRADAQATGHVLQ